MKEAYNPWRQIRGSQERRPAMGRVVLSPAGALPNSRGRKPPVCIARRSKPRRGDTGVGAGLSPLPGL